MSSSKIVPPNQSKLNCEVLSPELGLQLRWSLAGSSIILQIVANLGGGSFHGLWSDFPIFRK